MMESDSSWVNFSLGEDIRNENRLAQDQVCVKVQIHIHIQIGIVSQQWKNAIVDGRKHISHREANQVINSSFFQIVELIF